MSESSSVSPIPSTPSNDSQQSSHTSSTPLPFPSLLSSSTPNSYHVNPYTVPFPSTLPVNTTPTAAPRVASHVAVPPSLMATPVTDPTFQFNSFVPNFNSNVPLLFSNHNSTSTVPLPAAVPSYSSPLTASAFSSHTNTNIPPSTSTHHGHSHSHGPHETCSSSHHHQDEHGHSHGEHGHSHGNHAHAHAHAHAHGEHGHSHGEHGHSHSHGEHGHSHGEHGHSHGEHGSCNGHSHKQPTEDHHGHSHSHGGETSCSHSHGTAVNVGLTNRNSSMPAFSPSLEISRPSSWMDEIQRYISLGWRGGDSRYVQTYLYIKIAFMTLQFLWGVKIYNIGLVSAAFHTGFDIIAISCSWLAMIIAKQPAKAPYGFGYDRFEVVGAFTNSIFLYFVAIFQIIETFHNAFIPTEEISLEDLYLGVIGLAMDIFGLILFKSFLTLRKVENEQTINNIVQRGILTSTSDKGHAANMHAVSLHPISHAISHLGLLLACAANYHTSTPMAFPLSNFVTALLIFKLTTPLFLYTGNMLLITAPTANKVQLERALREISFYDGVLEVRSTHWWVQSPGVNVGNLHVRIRADANEQTILTYVHTALRKHIHHLTVQVEKDQAVSSFYMQPQTIN